MSKHFLFSGLCDSKLEFRYEAMKLQNLTMNMKDNHENYIEFYNRGLKIKKTYAELYEDVSRTLSLIQKHGLEKKGKVAIISNNRYEWTLVDLACMLGGYILIAFHAKDFETGENEIYNKYEADLTFIEEKYITDGMDRASLVEIEHLTDLLASEKPTSVDEFHFQSDEEFTCVFTSGTTGEPKGLGIITGAIDHIIDFSASKFNYSVDDKVIVFLPLSIFTSRLYFYAAILMSVNIIVTVPELVLSALRLYQPTILQSVPNFFEAIYNAYHQKVRSALSSRIIYRLFVMMHRIIPLSLRKKLHEKLFGEVISYFGGRMRIMITGTAPIPVRVLDFYNLVGITLLESYGLNETGVIALNSLDANRRGSVGKPVQGFHVKLDQDGQVMVKSDYIWSRGYFNDEGALQQQIFRNDGYIATGDIGYFDNDGYLYLQGRISEVIALTNGQKTHPTIIENKLKDSPLIRQVMVTGNRKPYLVAVVFSGDQALTHTDLKNEISKINRSFPEYLRVKNFHLARSPFTMENNQLSNNLKLNRREIELVYRKEISSMYQV